MPTSAPSVLVACTRSMMTSDGAMGGAAIADLPELPFATRERRQGAHGPLQID